LGITEHDIYSPKMNFIYGTSYLNKGVGLISTYRIADYYYEAKSNIRKVVTKQIINLFSIANVKDYVCVSNFHNNIEELRAGVFFISPRALEKLKYNIGFDHRKRFNELRNFHHKESEKNMEAYYEKCIQLMAY
jgi:archaemetzincin